MHASVFVQAEPAALELKGYLQNMERDYLLQRSKIEQIVTRDASKVDLVRKKMEKLRKYMDDLLKDT